MEVINQSVKFRPYQPASLECVFSVADAARTCYQSEKGGVEKEVELIKRCIRKGHESVLEHINIGVSFITDRGVTHELVRHRLAAYSQESTRYVKYQGGMRFIQPVWLPNLIRVWDHQSVYWARQRGDISDQEFYWLMGCQQSEIQYSRLIDSGWSPQQARTVLNNSLKTQIEMTCNLREWRHILRLRCSKAAHPQMRELMRQTLSIFVNTYTPFFQDIWHEVEG